MKFLIVPTLTLSLCLTLSVSFADTRLRQNIRLMTANITSTKDSGYDEPGIRIVQGLKPDVVMIQEFSYKDNTAENIQELTQRMMGCSSTSEKIYVYREEEGPRNKPNGIISRFPIIKSGEWQDEVVSDRDFAFAQLDIPGERDLWVISVHLKASRDSKEKRNAQSRALMTYINKNIPSKDLVALGGDLNTSSYSESVYPIFENTIQDPMVDAHTVLSQKDKPRKYQSTESSVADQATNMTNKYPYDQILVDQDLALLQIPTEIKAQDSSKAFVAGAGLIFDSTVFPFLDLVKPIALQDSRAGMMQHLAVIKDFLIPSPLTP